MIRTTYPFSLTFNLTEYLLLLYISKNMWTEIPDSTMIHLSNFSYYTILKVCLFSTKFHCLVGRIFLQKIRRKTEIKHSKEVLEKG